MQKKIRGRSLRLVKPASSGEPPAPRRGASVLIVDDENTIRDFLRSAFEAEGYTVLAAGDGIDALALCERYRPDVILLDLMMPRLDGLGFIHEYRRRFGLDSTAIFIMSAVRSAVEHAEASGVAGAFAKPFDLDEIIAAVGVALQGDGDDRALEDDRHAEAC
jgi:DNA-binding response OmpR family regulator